MTKKKRTWIKTIEYWVSYPFQILFGIILAIIFLIMVLVGLFLDEDDDERMNRELYEEDHKCKNCPYQT